MINKTYKAFCTNEECGYIKNRSWSFIPRSISEEHCPRCQSAYEVREVEDEGLPSSAALVSGVGEINSRLGGDFRDLMQKIKDNSPRCNMKDYK